MKPGTAVSGQEESFKHVTEKMALPRAHGAGMLPKACDARKHVSRGPHMDPSLTASRARIQASEEPLGKVAGPVALYGTVVEGWSGGESEGKAGGQRTLQPLRLICPGSVGMVGQCLRKGRLQMGVAGQTDSSWT